MRRIVVVGGSIAAVTAAQSLRTEGYDGQVTVVAEEPHPPYSRVPLSKGVLAGRESVESALLPLPSEDIEFRTGSRAARLDTHRRLVTTADGTDVPYDGLVIATGARARRLTGDSDLVVRTLDDASTLAARLTQARSAVVLGGGFLGMEVAGTCRALGLEVTVVDLLPPLLRLLGPWLADLAVAAARDHGIQVRVAPDGVDVLDEHRVRCGKSVLEADVIVCAVGDVPNTDWLKDSGLRLDAAGGLVADARCRVAPGIVAAGDVVSREGRRTPHWTNAVEQGRMAAASLLHGEAARPYRPDPYFWTEQSGLDIKISGELPLAGAPEVVAGSVDDRSVLLRWRHDRGTATAVAVNHRLPVVKLKRLGAGVPAPVPARTKAHR
ncbi:3-phenylpropionate/trans-cinnamate dioxygenase ferredoxin reductase subunit [Streptomyces sp. SAI-144]|uniref:NAD(P)/FAD-dependent oxidoreductase n=1 Tax=Streptomyces sp. SAI-144 TaxID=2940544 RepID=UPI002476F3AA|nr:FAD-dependent oxidoreductase [Streptomyces sp. SAI-144]MDH6437097.1 3-phenylpropionate/trans-cinnamate dioxygenase ferredoxin reductase subunit [Streptomyces sp. SAI-144]